MEIDMVTATKKINSKGLIYAIIFNICIDGSIPRLLSSFPIHATNSTGNATTAIIIILLFSAPNFIKSGIHTQLNNTVMAIPP